MKNHILQKSVSATEIIQNRRQSSFSSNFQWYFSKEIQVQQRERIQSKRRQERILYTTPPLSNIVHSVRLLTGFIYGILSILIPYALNKVREGICNDGTCISYIWKVLVGNGSVYTRGEYNAPPPRIYHIMVINWTDTPRNNLHQLCLHVETRMLSNREYACLRPTSNRLPLHTSSMAA